MSRDLVFETFEDFVIENSHIKVYLTRIHGVDFEDGKMIVGDSVNDDVDKEVFACELCVYMRHNRDNFLKHMDKHWQKQVWDI